MNLQQSFDLQTDTSEKILLTFQPEVPQFGQFQGQLSQVTWHTAAPVGTLLPADEEAVDFSTATYVFFHIGWTFLLIGVGLMIASSLLAIQWLGLVGVLALVICGIGFRQCLVRADNETPKDSQPSH